MTLTDIMNDKSIKKLQARTMIIDGIMQGNITIEEIEAASAELKDSRFSAVLLLTFCSMMNSRIATTGRVTHTMLTISSAC